MKNDKLANKIGKKIKLRRKELGMSQEKLGEAIGVSYQQIQKYEKGIDKISLEKLVKIATALALPLSFFLEIIEKEGEEKMEKGEELRKELSPEERELIRYFRAIGDPELKSSFVSLLKAVGKK